MVARDVVVVLMDFHADPFQSGFDSQHRQEISWIENRDGLIPLYLSLKFFFFIFGLALVEQNGFFFHLFVRHTCLA